MDLVCITSFVAVVRSGSFTRAAQELGYGQSTVSGHIRALERALRAPLVERDPRGARPTPAGAAVLPHALTILEAAAAARRSCTPRAEPSIPAPRARAAVGAPTACS